MDIIANIDIFFTLLMSAVYFAFVFFTKTVDSKFIVFFISCFINIFNYSIVLKNEINFLSVLTLNIFFIIVVIFLYMSVNTDSNLLSSDYIESSDIKNIVTILIFVFSFISISYIFYSLNKNKDKLITKQLNNVIIADNNYYYKKNNLKQEKLTLKIDNKNYVIYNKNISFIENNKIIKHYNLIILFYIVILITAFIYNNTREE